MALIQDTGGQGGRFLKILDGNIVERSKTQQDGFELYKTKNPQTGEDVEYYIRRYAAVAGNFARLERVERPENQIFGYNLVLNDEEGEFTLFLKDKARTTNRFLKVFENLDLDKEIRIDVWKDRDGNTAITFKQDGQNISQKWDKNSFPENAQPEQVMGKWDYSAQDKFLYRRFVNELIPNLPVKERARAASASGEAVEDDPVPF
jgi:hypothetical protein